MGIAISDKVLPADLLRPQANAQANANDAPIAATANIEKNAAMKNVPVSDIFQNIKFVVHRNGEADSCAESISNLSDIMPTSKNSHTDKYEFDHFLTSIFGKVALDSSTCGPEQPPPEIMGKRRKTWGRGEDYSIDGIDSAFLTFCDMGEEHTTILPDHKMLIPVMTDGVETLPCHFHTREGFRFTSYKSLVHYVQQIKTTKSEESQEEECYVTEDGSTICTSTVTIDVHIYAVPAGRPFLFAPSFIGEEFHIDHVESGRPFPISLKVMSLSPRVFDIINFFDRDESKAIVDKALAEKSESHRIKRSSTGSSGYNVNSQRTSENGFDT